MYIQLHMIKHINRQFVVLHTCTQILVHTRRAHNNKRQYFIEPFLIRSVRCLQTQAFLTMVSGTLVLSRLTTAVVIFFILLYFFFCLAVEAALKFQFQNSDFILAIPRLYLTIMIRKINWPFSLLSYSLSHTSGFFPLQNGKTRYC